MRLSSLATRAMAPVYPLSINAVSTPSRHPARTGLVDDQRPSRRGLGEDVVDGKWCEPAHVDDPGEMPSEASLRATRRLILTPLPNVTIVRSLPSP